MSTSVHPTYPVHVDAEPDVRLSRWLWLVKWLLVLPHYVVLAFLWLAFVLLSVAAFFAILFTGRYPRTIFDFNVGVLRWSWRVGYYAYAALGTDRYPPFTLDEVPDYPAHLSVDYPEHLSRGLVLVKWWLLAIPHYLVVGLLVGSGAYVAWDVTGSDQVNWLWGGGLIGLLVLVAAVVLAVTGTYPRQIFDLVLGLNRWVVRVAAYAGLMTDEYPPFRLDQGGPDPTGSARVSVPETSGTPAATPLTWSAGRVVTVVLAGLVFLVAGGLLTAGATLGVAGQTMRDDAGFLVSPEQSVGTSTFAVVSEPLELASVAAGDAVPRSLLGTVVIRATGDDAPVFLGVARATDAAEYLDGVAHATLLRIERLDGVDTPVYRELPGAAPGVAPEESDIWVASTTGTGEVDLAWEPEGGEWVVVLMNADAAPSVSADVSLGATFPVLGWVVAGLLVAGGLLLLLAILLGLAALYGGRRRGNQGNVPLPEGER